MRAEQRGRLIWTCLREQPGRSPGRRRVSMSGQDGKPFAVPKQLVWQAWKQVKANGGAAGADGVTIGMFETDLKDNLYKVWNRMSSGTYFPPPVGQWRYRRPREAPECSACRPWATGWRRQRPQWRWSRGRRPSFMMTPTATGPGRARWTRWLRAASGAGRGTG